MTSARIINREQFFAFRRVKNDIDRVQKIVERAIASLENKTNDRRLRIERRLLEIEADLPCDVEWPDDGDAA